MDPQYNSVETNSEESVGKGRRMKKHKKASGVTYPQKSITGQEKKIQSDPTTTSKRITKKSGAKKYTRVKK